MLGGLYATPVTGFSAFYKNGQVFSTWNNLSATGIQYRLYKSSFPILHGSDLINCEYLGAVHDSSSFNKHLTEVAGQSYFLKTDSTSNPLGVDTGLFVSTTEVSGDFFYALTTMTLGIEDTMIIPGQNSLISSISEIAERPKAVFQTTLNISNYLVDIYVVFTSLTANAWFPQMVNVGSYGFNFAVLRNGTGLSHPLTIRLAGGGGNFLSGIGSGTLPEEYRMGIDDWLPNEENSSWFGYHENYDIFSHNNPPPVSGINHDYASQLLEFIIDWAIRNLPLDTNSVYFNGVSAGASGAFFSSLSYPDRIAASVLKVPKFDLSFLHDPDTTNNYNEGKPGRLRVDTLLGTVPVNLPTNLGPLTYDLLNGGWLAHQHANDNVPLLFAVSGKNDTMVGWAEKIPYYDSVNANRLGGFYFWDQRTHNGDGAHWNISPDLMRYHRNLSFPAFSNCSANNNPGDGHADSGDSVGTINGFLDWNDSIADDSDQYQIEVFMQDLPTYFDTIKAPDSCFTDITLRRLQHFAVPSGWEVLWEVYHHGQLIQKDTFPYSSGLITLQGVKIYKDTSVIHVSFDQGMGETIIGHTPAITCSVYPNPGTGNFTVCFLDGDLSDSHHLMLKDLSGRLLYEWNQKAIKGKIGISFPDKIASGTYLLQIDSERLQFAYVLIEMQ